MSTYQVRLQEAFVADGELAMARHYPLRLAEPIGFPRLREALGDLLFDGHGSGLLVNNFATVNAGAEVAGGKPFAGRLYGIVIARDAEELTRVDDEITHRLAVLEKGE
jgi:hypothetical protein